MHHVPRMKPVLAFALLAAIALPGQEHAPEINVNARYTVESVDLIVEQEGRLSKGLRDDVQKLVGEKFDQAALDELAKRVRNELGGRIVATRVLRGDKPEHVKVVIEVTPPKEGPMDLSLSKFLYHSKQGWSVKAIVN